MAILRSNWVKPNKTTRRALLKGAGSATILAPFVPIMNASGQEGQPKRLVLWFTPHGTIQENWRPDGGTTNFEMNGILKPLESFKDQLNILDGIRIIDDGVGFPHTKGPPLLWTASPLLESNEFRRGGMNQGWNSAPSVDQVLLERLKPETPFKSLEFGVRTGNAHPGHRMIFSGPEQPLQPQNDPWSAVENIFTGVGEGTAGAAFEQVRAQRQSVMDVVTQELNSVLPRVSLDDRLKVESHLQAIRDIETSLQGQSGAVCSGAPNLNQQVNAGSTDNTERVWDAQMDLLAASLGCDLTRVASMQYRDGENDDTGYGFIGLGGRDHHIETHGGNKSLLSDIYTWYSEKFARFLSRLAAVPEGNGTMLDNTLVVWGSELGHGRGHSFREVPFITAGGKNLGLPTGRYLRYDDVEHNRLLVSMLNLMGMPDVDEFGRTDRNKGPLENFV